MMEGIEMRNPRAFIDLNGGYQTPREGLDKEAHDAWVVSNTWNLTWDDFVRLSYFDGCLEQGSNGVGPDRSGSRSTAWDAVYEHPEKGVLVRSAVSGWLNDYYSFVRGFKSARKKVL